MDCECYGRMSLSVLMPQDMSTLLVGRSTDKLEFIPIKSWVATGSGAPGSCAGHN